LEYVARTRWRTQESNPPIGEEFTDGVIGKVAGAGKDSLLNDPGIRADLSMSRS